MRKLLGLLLILPALAGCGGDPAAGGNSLGQAFAPTSPGAPGAQDDCYTVCLIDFEVRQQAEYYRKAMAEQKGWKDVFLREVKASSPTSVGPPARYQVCYGRFRTLDDAQPNLKTAKAYRAQNGEVIFPRAIIVIIPGKDVGPEEWNLRSKSGPYHLVIASFADDPARNYVGRKNFAVDYCRQLRQGGYEAYFFHTPGVSYVVLGNFGPDAVTFTASGAQEENSARFAKLQIHDGRLIQWQKDFPQLSVNGNAMGSFVIDNKTGRYVMDRTTGKPVMLARPSYVARRDGESLTGLGDTMTSPAE